MAKKATTKKTGSAKNKNKHQLKKKSTATYAAGQKARSGAYPTREQNQRAASKGKVAENRLLENAVSVGNYRGNTIDGDGMRLSGTPLQSRVNATGRQRSGGKAKSITRGTTKAKTARNQRAGGASQKMTPKTVTRVANKTKPKATLQNARPTVKPTSTTRKKSARVTRKKK